MRPARVVLDANVLVDAQVRDVFFTFAEAGLLDLRWSAEIVAEAQRALTARLQLNPSGVDRLFAAIDRAFPHAVVAVAPTVVEALELPDPGDRHVLAAAVTGECDIIVTYNVQDFPDAAVEECGVEVLAADECIVMLANAYPHRVAELVAIQLARLRRPSLTQEEFLDRLAARVPAGAAAFRSILGRVDHDAAPKPPATEAAGGVE